MPVAFGQVCSGMRHIDSLTLIMQMWQLPRTMVFWHAGDQRQGGNEQQGRHDVDPGLDAAGIIGTGEDRSGYRDCDDCADLPAHRP